MVKIVMSQLLLKVVFKGLIDGFWWEINLNH
jgi:hypothetical protein